MSKITWDVEFENGRHVVRLQVSDFSGRKVLSIDDVRLAFERQPRSGQANERLSATSGVHSLNIDITFVKSVPAFVYDLTIDDRPPVRGVPAGRDMRNAVIRGIVVGVVMASILVATMEKGSVSLRTFLSLPFAVIVFSSIVAFVMVELFMARRAAARYELALMGADSPATVTDPICPKCRTIYKRTAVIRQLKQQSPQMFDSALWTTKFRCLECGAEIVITGERS